MRKVKRGDRPAPPSQEETDRRRCAHGYVFRGHSHEENRAVSHWIQTGEETDHLPAMYPRAYQRVHG